MATTTNLYPYFTVKTNPSTYFTVPSGTQSTSLPSGAITSGAGQNVSIAPVKQTPTYDESTYIYTDSYGQKMSVAPQYVSPTVIRQTSSLQAPTISAQPQKLFAPPPPSIQSSTQFLKSDQTAIKMSPMDTGIIQKQTPTGFFSTSSGALIKDQFTGTVSSTTPTVSKTPVENLITSTAPRGLLVDPQFDANKYIYSQLNDNDLKTTDLKTKITAVDELYNKLSAGYTPKQITPSWDTSTSVAFAQQQDEKMIQELIKSGQVSEAKSYMQEKAKLADSGVLTENTRKAYFELVKSKSTSPTEALMIALDPNLSQTTKVQIALGLLPVNKEFATAMQTVRGIKKETSDLSSKIIKDKETLDISQSEYDDYVSKVKPKFDEYNNFIKQSTISVTADGTAILSPENKIIADDMYKKNNLEQLNKEWEEKNKLLTEKKITYGGYVSKYETKLANEIDAINKVNTIAEKLNVPGEKFSSSVSSLDPYSSLAISKYGLRPYAARESVTAATPVLREEASIYETEWRDPNIFERLGTQAKYTSGIDIISTGKEVVKTAGKYYLDPTNIITPYKLMPPFSTISISAETLNKFNTSPDKFLLPEFKLDKKFDTIKLKSQKYEDLPEVYKEAAQIRRVEDFYRPIDPLATAGKITSYTVSGAVSGAGVGAVFGGGVGSVPAAAAGAVTGGISGLIGGITDVAVSETLGRTSGSRAGGESVGLVAGIGTSILADIGVSKALNPYLIGKSKPYQEVLRPAEDVSLKIKKINDNTYKLTGKGTEYSSVTQEGTGIFNKGIDYSGSKINEFTVDLTFKNTANISKPGISTIETAGGLPEATLSKMKVGETVSLAKGTTFENFVETATGKIPDVPGISGTQRTIVSNNKTLSKFMGDMADNTAFDIKGKIKYIDLDTGKVTTTAIKNSSVVSADSGFITRTPTTVKVAEEKGIPVRLSSAEKKLQQKLASMKPNELALYKLTPDEELLMQNALQKKLIKESGENMAKKVDTTVDLDNLSFDLKSYSGVPSAKGKWSIYRTPAGQLEIAETFTQQPITKVTSKIYSPIKGGSSAKMKQVQSFLQLGDNADTFYDVGSTLYYSDIKPKSNIDIGKSVIKPSANKLDDLFTSGKISADQYEQFLTQGAKSSTPDTVPISNITIDNADDLFASGKISANQYDDILNKKVSASSTPSKSNEIINKLDDFVDNTKIIKAEYTKQLPKDNIKYGFDSGDNIYNNSKNIMTTSPNNKGGTSLMMEQQYGPIVQNKFGGQTITTYDDTANILKIQSSTERLLSSARPVPITQNIGTGLAFGIPTTKLKSNYDYGTILSPITKSASASTILKLEDPLSLQNTYISAYTVPSEKIGTSIVEKVDTSQKIDEITSTGEKIDTKIIDPTVVPNLITLPFLGGGFMGFPGMGSAPSPSSGSGGGGRRRPSIDKARGKRQLIQVKSSLFRKFAFGEKDFYVTKESLAAFKQKIAEKGTFFGYDAIPTSEQAARAEKKLMQSQAEGKILKGQKSILDIKV